MATTLPWMPTITQMVYLEICTGHLTKSRHSTDRERRAKIPPPTSMILTGLFVLVTSAGERRWRPCTDYKRALCWFFSRVSETQSAHTHTCTPSTNFTEKGGRKCPPNTQREKKKRSALNESTDCER